MFVCAKLGKMESALEREIGRGKEGGKKGGREGLIFSFVCVYSLS